MALEPRIDVHSHILPQFYREALTANGHDPPDGMPAIPQWSLEDHLHMMQENNITTSIVSISTPGVLLKPDDTALAAALARRVNAYAAELKRDHPGRFGFFASLPLPDVDAALEEIDRAYADGADGVVLMSNYAGLYPTEARFAPVWAALDRRAAKVFFHPTTPCIRCSASTAWRGKSSSSSSPSSAAAGLDVQWANPFLGTFPAPLVEFLFETARVAASLFLLGVVERYPSVTFLLPHAGGALPPLLSRIVGFGAVVQAPGFPQRERERPPLSEDEAVRLLNERFYFDLAGWSFPRQWRMLVEGLGLGRDRLLFGTDYAFTPAPMAAEFGRVMLEGMSGWTAEHREMALSKNAKLLFGLKD